MITSISSWARYALLTAAICLGAFAQTNPSGICPQTDNNRPQFAAGASDTIWLCNPVSGTASWVQIYPVGGKSATSPTALASNTVAGNTAMRVCHATYNFAVDGGVVGLITPSKNCVLPANAVVYNVGLEWTTAGTSLGSATIAVGLAGTGGGAAVIKAATAVASATGVLQSLIVPQTASGWKKLTTSATTGAVTFTVAVADLTAGVAEVYVMYFDSAS